MSAVLDLTEIRAREPHRIADGWAARTRRPLLGTDGRLLLVAADHPARGALGVRSDGMAMASRPASWSGWRRRCRARGSTGSSALRTSSTTCC